MIVKCYSYRFYTMFHFHIIFIAVCGYLRTMFQSITSGNNASYGSGAITDLRHRLPVNITSFDGVSSPPKGSFIKINGAVRMNNYSTIILHVDCMSNITRVNDDIKTQKEMQQGFLALTVNKAEEEEEESADTRRKSHAMIDSKIPSKVSI